MINNYIKNAKFIMSNRLKFIKLLVFAFVLCLINISYSNAACDFDGLRIGEKSSDAEGTFGEASTSQLSASTCQLMISSDSLSLFLTPIAPNLRINYL